MDLVSYFDWLVHFSCTLMFWFIDTPSLLTYLVTTQSCPNIICLCLFHVQLCMILFVHGVIVSSPCVLSNKYPLLFALLSYCCISSFYQVFLFYNLPPPPFFFLPFLLIFPLLGTCFTIFSISKNWKKRKKIALTHTNFNLLQNPKSMVELGKKTYSEQNSKSCR